MGSSQASTASSSQDPRSVRAAYGVRHTAYRVWWCADEALEAPPLPALTTVHGAGMLPEPLDGLCVQAVLWAPPAPCTEHASLLGSTKRLPPGTTAPSSPTPAGNHIACLPLLPLRRRRLQCCRACRVRLFYFGAVASMRPGEPRKLRGWVLQPDRGRRTPRMLSTCIRADGTRGKLRAVLPCCCPAVLQTTLHVRQRLFFACQAWRRAGGMRGCEFFSFLVLSCLFLFAGLAWWARHMRRALSGK